MLYANTAVGRRVITTHEDVSARRMGVITELGFDEESGEAVFKVTMGNGEIVFICAENPIEDSGYTYLT